MPGRSTRPASRRAAAPLAGFLALAALLSTGPTCEDAQAPERFLGETVTIRGRLTSEGVQCPTMRDRLGVIYSLVGPIGQFRTGDWVCVRGKVVDRSICGRGVSIEMQWIEPARMCP